MKIQSQGTALVLAKSSRESSDRKSVYYNIAILVNNEAGNLSCTKEVFESSVLYQQNELFYEYNSEYRSFRVVGAIPVNSVLSSETGQNAGADIAASLAHASETGTNAASGKPDEDKKGSKPDKSGK